MWATIGIIGGLLLSLATLVWTVTVNLRSIHRDNERDERDERDRLEQEKKAALAAAEAKGRIEAAAELKQAATVEALQRQIDELIARERRQLEEGKTTP